jgi:hypothetical protein
MGWDRGFAKGSPVVNRGSELWSNSKPTHKARDAKQIVSKTSVESSIRGCKVIANGSFIGENENRA